MFVPVRVLGLLGETKVVRALALRIELLQVLLSYRPESEVSYLMYRASVVVGDQ